MRAPTSLERITADVGQKNKKAFVKYTTDRGWNISYVVRKLIEKLLAGEVQL